jgi:hypothetical protein
MLSTSLAIRLRDDIRAHPLQVSEIRRISGTGLFFITLSMTDVSSQGLMVLFNLSIDGVSYAVVRPEPGYEGYLRSERESL